MTTTNSTKAAAAARVERLAEARKEKAAVRAAKAQGKPAPATPVADAIAAEKAAPKPAKAPRQPAAKGREGQTVVFVVDGVPRLLLNRRYTLGYLAAELIGGAGATETLRAELAKAKVKDVDAGGWTATVRGHEVKALVGDEAAKLVKAGPPDRRAIRSAAVKAQKAQTPPAAPKRRGRKPAAPAAAPADDVVAAATDAVASELAANAADIAAAMDAAQKGAA